MQEHTEVRPPRRRRHSAEFKAEAVNACTQPGVSIAAVALHYQLNANLLRRWIAESESVPAAAPSRSALVAPAAEFMPLPLPPHASSAGQEIAIEVKRGAATVTIRWPHAAAADCASWLQGWLR